MSAWSATSRQLRTTCGSCLRRPGASESSATARVAGKPYSPPAISRSTPWWTVMAPTSRAIHPRTGPFGSPTWCRSCRSCPRRFSACSVTRIEPRRRSTSTNFEAILRANGKQSEFYRYTNAGHGFFAVDRTSYRVIAAVDGWERIASFFTRHIAPEG